MSLKTEIPPQKWKNRRDRSSIRIIERPCRKEQRKDLPLTRIGLRFGCRHPLIATLLNALKELVKPCTSAPWSPPAVNIRPPRSTTRCAASGDPLVVPHHFPCFAAAAATRSKRFQSSDG